MSRDGKKRNRLLTSKVTLDEGSANFPEFLGGKEAPLDSTRIEELRIRATLLDIGCSLVLHRLRKEITRGP